MLLWRSLFFVALVFVAQFFIRSELLVDTDLKDLSPALSKQQDIQFAINQFSSDVEQRFMLLVTGNDADTVEQASEQLRQGVSVIVDLKVSTQKEDQTLLLEQLKLYRFHLLTPSQQQQLEQFDNLQLTTQARKRLFQLHSSVSVLPFAQDPMGWFGDYVLYLTEQINGLSGVNELEDNNVSSFYQVIPVSIEQGALEMATQRSLQTQLRQLEQALQEQYAVSILHSGVFFFAAEAASNAKRDISTITTFSLLGIFILLLLAFRSFAALLLPFLSIAIGVGFALAITHTYYASIHVLTIVFGASLIGIVIDYSLHYFYHHNSHRDAQHNKHLYGALLLSLVTSLIGFGALGISDLEALKKLAVFACCGLSMAWLSVICLGPWVLRKPLVLDQRIIPGLLNIVVGPLKAIQSKLILMICGAILFSFIGLFYAGIPGDDDPRLFFRPSATLLEQEQLASELVNTYEPGRYIIVSGVNPEQVYTRFNELRGALDMQIADNLTTVMNWLPSPQQQKHNYQLQKRLYQNNGVVEQLLMALGMPTNIVQNNQVVYEQSRDDVLLPQQVLEALQALPGLWLEYNKQHYSFVLIPKGTDIIMLEQASDAIGGIDFINTVALAKGALQQQRHSASKLLLFAYLLIALLMLLRFAKLNAIAMLVVPGIATLCTVMILVLFEQALNLFHTMALFLVLGLGMDYVIFAREMHQSKFTQQAILLSALTSLFSFGLLSMSSIPVVQAFGLTVLIGNTFNLLGALIYAQNIKEQHYAKN